MIGVGPLCLRERERERERGERDDLFMNLKNLYLKEETTCLCPSQN